jgi:protein gp37
MLDQPKRWKRPRKIFVCSMSDLFHDDVSDYFITRVFEVMLSESTQQHTFLVLTKRPIRMRAWFNSLPNVPHNVWAGVTVENQAAADERIPILTELAAPVRFLSCEPLVGPVWLPTDGGPYPIDWVIVAGESGPKARPMQKQWVMDLWNRTKYGLQVPFFFKQWGEFDENGGRVGKKAAGDLIDGVRYQEFPEV